MIKYDVLTYNFYLITLLHAYTNINIAFLSGWRLTWWMCFHNVFNINCSWKFTYNAYIEYLVEYFKATTTDNQRIFTCPELEGAYESERTDLAKDAKKSQKNNSLSTVPIFYLKMVLVGLLLCLFFNPIFFPEKSKHVSFITFLPRKCVFLSRQFF